MLTRFYLGTHMPHWLAKPECEGVPLFISRIRLERYKNVPRAVTDWALDSGGFSQLSEHGKWTVTAAQYVDEVRRYSHEIGRLQWAACMDWMCEPFITQKTGFSVAEHQRRTIASYLELCGAAPELPWVPVLQGWEEADYMSHVEQYAAAGVDLVSAPLVGIGSVCRRQHTDEAELLICKLAGMGIRLHGFGFKLTGLLRAAHALHSADSMAWSFAARKSPGLPGHAVLHKTCANCLPFAMQWRQNALRRIRQGTHSAQEDLFCVAA